MKPVDANLRKKADETDVKTEIYRLPEEEKTSELYSVSIGGQALPARYCRVSAMPYNTVWPGRQRPIDQTEEAAFVNFRTDGPAELEIIAGEDLRCGPFTEKTEITLRPLSSGVRAEISGNKASLKLPGPGYYTFEPDGFHNALHIFADGPETKKYEEDGAAATYRFERGVFSPGLIELRSGESLYIGEDAVVYGSVIVRDAQNVRIFGTGVIDNSLVRREDANCLDPGTLKIIRCKNVAVEGITFRDSSAWTATVIQSDNVGFDRVKLIGMWRYNSDGIDLVNSRNCTITNSFLRNFDDVVVLKGLKQYDTRNVENIYVARCTLWCDWGRALEIGAETCTDDYRNIIFEDCDIIHGDCILMDLQNGDRASVHGVIFSRIRCEYTSRQLRPVYQSDMNAPYDGKSEEGLFVPLLFKAHLYCGLWSNDMLYGENRDVLLEDIEILTDGKVPVPAIVLEGATPANRTFDITVRNLTFNGKKLSSNDVPVSVGNFAEPPVIV